MPKRKVKERTAPSRKSRRLLEQTQLSEDAAYVASVLDAVKRLSTELESPEKWPTLKAQAETRLREYRPGGRDGDDKLVALLQALLDWLPEEGIDSIARDVNQSETDEALYGVFANLCSGLVYPMKATSGRSSVAESSSEKRREPAESIAAALPYLETRDPSFRKTCLRREGYRCIVTKYMDTEHWVNVGEPGDVDYGDFTRCAHHPFCIRLSRQKDVSKAWEAIFRCFPSVRRAGMSIERINDPSNGMMMVEDLHRQFDKFRFSLVATETPNVYKMKLYKKFSRYGVHNLPEDRLVTLTNAPGGEDIALPSATLLDCHHRVAEVFNASGMAEEIDKKINEWENLKHDSSSRCLREDGTSDVSRSLSLGLWMSV
ncbi:hypothetical protein FQN55_003673 [Onygenales sp. PD_40]|nr:hypothetical protein FQN55_003673 [Onygenales sp. PD_40]